MRLRYYFCWSVCLMRIDTRVTLTECTGAAGQQTFGREVRRSEPERRATQIAWKMLVNPLEPAFAYNLKLNAT